MVYDRALAEGLEAGWWVCWEAGCGEVGAPRVVYEGVDKVYGLLEFPLMSRGWE